MSATIFYLSAEVREAALDLKSLRRRIGEAGPRGFEWRPAEANARKRLIGLCREHSEDRASLPSRQLPHPKPGEGFLKLA